jgi:hypothetical protein
LGILLDIAQKKRASSYLFVSWWMKNFTTLSVNRRQNAELIAQPVWAEIGHDQNSNKFMFEKACCARF